ncbi:hypothetical protein K432DRAFT_422005 [Lepidopterella palustris CBS 459.81]|uniref:Uncharacterized protein n=1 Tax=Lepidopterella palustris CBS 459.81 TaxID=1314670 RepID=A0A8E2JJY5_9PEZI|nr:hypothetical protein K432DRAFT_422005 [Lepidopterella palustris CBS 459.81]
MQILNEIMGNLDCILNIPLLITYIIAVSQDAWLYVILLPFHLFQTTGWATTSMTLIATYLILGIALIGNGSGIQNPLSYDGDDLPLAAFCKQIADDVAVITTKAPLGMGFVGAREKRVLVPLSGGEWV